MTNVRCLLIMFVKLHAVCPGLSARGSVGPDQRRQNFVSSKPGSQESHALPQLLTPPPPGAVLLTAAIPPCYSPVRRWRAGDGLLAHQAEDGRVLLPLHGRGAALAAAARPHHRHQVPPPLSTTPWWVMLGPAATWLTPAAGRSTPPPPWPRSRATGATGARASEERTTSHFSYTSKS